MYYMIKFGYLAPNPTKYLKGIEKAYAKTLNNANDKSIMGLGMASALADNLANRRVIPGKTLRVLEGFDDGGKYVSKGFIEYAPYNSKEYSIGIVGHPKHRKVTELAFEDIKRQPTSNQYSITPASPKLEKLYSRYMDDMPLNVDMHTAYS